MARSRKYPSGGRRIAPKRRRATKRVGPLATYVLEHARTLTSLAAELDISVQHLSNILHGHTKPGRKLAGHIEAHTGGAVPAGSWD